MARFLVRGESTVQWDLDITVDGDHNDAVDRARALIADHFRVELELGDGDKSEIVGQQDRVFKVRDAS